ncbi:fungal-specific transcription factor domain-containing protein [Phellopilus nigrolimitatus]|nr:fungal-specific transcription factor domain-containing protein [Phellopilus nigrolimitatus]
MGAPVSKRHARPQWSRLHPHTPRLGLQLVEAMYASPTTSPDAASASASDASPSSSTSSEYAFGHQPGSRNPKSEQTRSNSKEQRVPLACLRCRSKRARCSGVRPRCKACENANVECLWPEGRKRKRTRKEMEEAERLEREAVAASAAQKRSPTVVQSSPQHNSQNAHHTPVWDFTGMDQRALALTHGASSDEYVWPRQDPSSRTVAAGSCSFGSDFAAELLAGAGVPASSSTQATQLMRALQAHTAFIEGDPSTKQDLELFYFRICSGSTAIHPGINRISLKLQSLSVNITPSTASAPVPSKQPTQVEYSRPEELFDEDRMPLPSVYIPLLDTFFRTMSQHFPSISRRRMDERLETGTMSAFLLNCICAISARFHPPRNRKPAEACAPFITKAQELMVPLLQLPTTDSVTGLLLLAWASYGQNSDAALWQYSGMAYRMAADLGMHEVNDIYETGGHKMRVRLLFWSLYITDRIISFSTGRPVTIPDDAIELPLPSDDDFFPDPARNTDVAALHEPVEPIPFQYLVRVLVLCGRIATMLNGRRGRPRTLVGPSDVDPQALSALQSQLVQFYATLPDSMKWSVDNFKHHEGRGHGGTFLTLHLWANGVMALVYHPELTSSRSGAESPFSQGLQHSIRLSLSSSRSISECLELADLFSSQAYLGSPFAVQPIYVACLTFIYEMKCNLLGHQSGITQDETDTFLTSIARQNLSVLTKVLQRMERYWAGILYVTNALEQRAADLGYSRADSTPSPIKTFISLPDKGLLHRYSGKDLPHNTAPATETSLRTWMEEDAAASSQFYVEDLLSTYSIQSMLVQPVDNYDLQHLLAAGAWSDGSGASGSSGPIGPRLDGGRGHPSSMTV